MITPEQLYEQLVFILQVNGEIEVENPIRIETVYRDERIEITGVIDPSSRSIAAVYVNINLPSSDTTRKGVFDQHPPPFTLPRSEPQYETQVFQWNEGTVYFYRPGLWTAYIGHLVRDIQAEIEGLKLMNGVPVDDTALFDDVPLNR